MVCGGDGDGDGWGLHEMGGIGVGLGSGCCSGDLVESAADALLPLLLCEQQMFQVRGMGVVSVEVLVAGFVRLYLDSK